MKSSPKELRTAEAIRRNIVSGKWPLGRKIPPYSELEKIFPVSRVTLRRAVSRLQREGFLKGFEREGVYVSEKPPHLNRIALLLASPPEHNRFAAILAKDSAEAARREGFELLVLSHLNRPFYKTDEAEELMGDLALNRCAGILAFFDPEGCPVPRIFDAKIPKIFLSGYSKRDGFTIALDNKTLAFRAMKWLKDNGSRRVAVLAYGSDNPLLEHAKTLFARFGLETRPEWNLGFFEEGLADSLARLLFSLPQNRRPDGLFIADDNFTEHVARGIIAAGIRVPEDLKIISHCNWSMPPERFVPMELIGFDSRQIISEGIRMIKDFHDGRKIASISLKPLLGGGMTSSTRGKDERKWKFSKTPVSRASRLLQASS